MTERTKRRARPIAAALALAALGALGLALRSGGGDGAERGPGVTDAAHVSAHDARFAALSGARTNSCGLGAGGLRRMEDGMRLQGSCCFPMDRAHYEQQLHEFGRYRSAGVVPRDPYDVPVKMAKRLLTYRDIPLDRRQQAAYDRATELSDLGGPCCCPCWRWETFKGQAHFLLARRDWSAAEVARLWEAEEGCGGPGRHA